LAVIELEVLKMEDSQVLKELGIDIEFLGYVRNQLLNIEDRLVLFNKLVSFDDAKLNKLIKMAEGAAHFCYAEQEVLYGWEIELLQIIGWACNGILLKRAMKFHIPR